MKSLETDQLMTMLLSEQPTGLELQPLQDSGLNVPARLRVTKGLQRVLNRMKYAVTSKAPLAIVVGTHGGGKSTAARVFASARKTSMYWECPPEYSAKAIVADLCERLGLQVGEAWRVRTNVLVEHLRDHPRTLILDEAQRLDYRALDMLKFLADQTGCTVILVGSPWMENQIDRRSDISSRVWVRVRVDPISLEDFREVYARDGYTPKTLDAIHALSGGVLRRAEALLTHLENYMHVRDGITPADITPEHVRAAAEVVL